MTPNPSAGLPSVLKSTLVTVALVVALISMLALTARLEEGGLLGFLLPFRRYIVVAEIAGLGLMAVESGSRLLFAVAVRHVSRDVASALRIIARIGGYGVLLSTVVSVLTANAAAALTLGSFAGLVAGFGSQTVMSNAIAGVFLAIARPIHLGDRVTIGPNSGIVKDVTLMHIVLDAQDREIFIPSATTIGSVLIRHKPEKPPG